MFWTAGVASKGGKNTQRLERGCRDCGPRLTTGTQGLDARAPLLVRVHERLEQPECGDGLWSHREMSSLFFHMQSECD